jgi:uncharacterized protein DUF6675
MVDATHANGRSSPRSRAVYFCLAAGMLLFSLPAAADMPSPPCREAASPILPRYADPPNVMSWRGADLAGWAPPTCANWATARFTRLTAVAGSFRFAGSADDLLGRFAAISNWRGIQYWSVTDGNWETLITDSTAVGDETGDSRRPDFTVAELKTRKDLYFVQRDNRSSGDVIYRMRVVESGLDRFTINVENVSSVWVFVFPIFAPGDLVSTYIVERLSPTEWGYYSLSGARSSDVGRDQEASYANRALAIYRHILSVPFDRNAAPSR